jgi:hypothetical protein
MLVIVFVEGGAVAEFVDWSQELAALDLIALANTSQVI